MKGRIATAQDRTLDRIRTSRKALDRAERAAKEGKFLTTRREIETAIEAARSGAIHAQRGHDGLLDVLTLRHE